MTYNPEIIIRVEAISNGFIVTASKGMEDGYRTAELPQTYVPDRKAVLDGLISLFEAADNLTVDQAREDF